MSNQGMIVMSPKDYALIVEALSESAQHFAMYALHHAAKGNEEKAAENTRMLILCNKALEGKPT